MDDRFRLKMQSNDGSTFVHVSARVTNKLPDNSMFDSLEEASNFFRNGSMGWSARPKAEAFDGLELHCDQWQMELLVVDEVQSSFFDDKKLFPPGSAKFDSAFLMRNIAHEWHGCGQLNFK